MLPRNPRSGKMYLIEENGDYREVKWDLSEGKSISNIVVPTENALSGLKSAEFTAEVEVNPEFMEEMRKEWIDYIRTQIEKRKKELAELEEAYERWAKEYDD